MAVNDLLSLHVYSKYTLLFFFFFFFFFSALMSDDVKDRYAKSGRIYRQNDKLNIASITRAAISRR